MFGQSGTRREALQAIVLAIGGASAAAAFAGCASEPERTQVTMGSAGRFFSAGEMAILSDVAEIMIPETETLGASAANVHGFVDGMMADWASAATKDQFRRALALFDDFAGGPDAGRYLALPLKSRIERVSSVDATCFSSPNTPDAKAYQRLKWLVFEGYWTSKEANPDYRLNPGVYRGDLTETEYRAMLGA